ncbi:NAD-dependent epimerase/dehydratase family protein [Halobacteriovorax marinus]|nr:NAD-dependent epimerase/dehydratase family protein [Halobacteriovorax marinus]
MENTKKRTLVIGGSGFIGTHTVNSLLDQDHQVGVISRSIGIHNNVEYYCGNILDEDFLSQSISDFDPNFVIHLAGSKNRSIQIDDFKSDINTNLNGTLNIFGCLISLKSLEQVIVVGSTEEYGDAESVPFVESMNETPISSYSFSKTCTKYLAETFARVYGLPVAYVRPSIAYGPRQNPDMFISSLCTTLLKGERFQMSSGEQRRDFIYIDDLVELFMAIINFNSPVTGTFNAGGGSSVQIKKIAMMIADKLSSESLIDIGHIKTRALESDEHLLDNSKASSLLNWNPTTSLEEGISKTVEFFSKSTHEE